MEATRSTGSSAFGAAVNIAKLSIGNGILALPYATSRGGLLFSPIAIAVIAMWNILSCFMMIDCKRAIINHRFPIAISSSYSRLSFAAFGYWGAILTDLSVFATLFGVCVSYQIAFTQFLRDIPSHPLSNWSDFAQTVGYTYFSVIVVYPLACQKNIGFLSYTSLAGLSCLILSIGVLLWYGFDESYTREKVSVTMWPESFASFTTFSGVAIFCYGLCTFTFPIEESMNDRGQFSKAVIWSTTFVTLFYIFLGDALSYVYAPGIDQNILHNLPIHSTPAILIRLALALVLSIPLALVPSSQIAEQWSIGLMYSETGTRTQESLNLNIHQKDYESISAKEEDVYLLKEEDQTSNIFRYCIRFALLVGCSLLATHVPCFGLVVSLLGSFTVCMLSFVLPSSLHVVLILNPKFQELENHNQRGTTSVLWIQWLIEILLTFIGCCVCTFATGMTSLEAYRSICSTGHC